MSLGVALRILLLSLNKTAICMNVISSHYTNLKSQLSMQFETLLLICQFSLLNSIMSHERDIRMTMRIDNYSLLWQQ